MNKSSLLVSNNLLHKCDAISKIILVNYGFFCLMIFHFTFFIVLELFRVSGFFIVLNLFQFPDFFYRFGFFYIFIYFYLVALYYQKILSIYILLG